jgi:hypothetical protein
MTPTLILSLLFVYSDLAGEIYPALNGGADAEGASFRPETLR